MIKSNVTVCAVINRAATVKEGKENGTFISFSLNLSVKGRHGSEMPLEISVSADGDKSSASIYTQGRRVLVKGTLSLRKRGDKTYFNLRADSIDLVKTNESDKIEGDFHFKGKISKKGVEDITDSKGNPYQAFSAFSSDRDGDNVEFIWIRFLNFHPVHEDYMKPQAYVEVKGKLQLGVYKEALSIDCLVDEITPWELSHRS